MLDFLRKWLPWAAAGLGGLFLMVLLAAAVVPFAPFKNLLERRLSARVGRPVTIASLARDGIGFHPTLVIRGLTMPQPAWAGAGDLAVLREGRMTFAILPALVGDLRPEAVTLDGLRLSLIRTADKRTNWDGGGKGGGAGGGLALSSVSVRDSVVDYRDAKQDRAFHLAIAGDPAHGLHADGTGTVRGTPVRMAIATAPFGSATGRWPVHAQIVGPALTMDAHAVADGPFALDAMTVDLTTRASDLKLVDAVIEAGLFGTQPVDLAAHARHDGKRWQVSDLRGHVGSSDIEGQITVDKVDGRTKLDGQMRSHALDFDDFASDEGKAKAAALRARIGKKLVPDTKINLAKVGPTDGRVAFVIDRLVSRQGQSALASMRGTLVMDHRRVTLAPLTIGLTRGTITGRAVIDQRDGGPLPLLTLDLRMRDSALATLAGGGGDFSGRVDGHARLAGRGATIRAAVGASDGHIGVVARDGLLPERIADAMGFDAGRALFAGSDDRAGLRCAVIGIDVHRGDGRFDPLIVDTSQSRLDGSGTIVFPAETLAVRLTGAPKRSSVLRLPGAIMLSGTLKEPDLVVPKQVKSAGNIFKAIGRAIKGDQGPLASDANCPALAARVLR